MSSESALSIQQVTKTYHLYDDPKDRLKQLMFRGKRRYYREYSALSSLSFELKKGEVLGVVGRNGAGKSTLLQLICGTLTPTSGQVVVQGRIAALLELGAGFNPQFTGRENIYLSAAIMGVSKQEIIDKVEDIIDFAGVRNFIDQPVSTYSSGMYVRLAFAVATSVEPDILIIDEALSVGDGDFARKSFERIMAMKERGATILFCSHALYQIEVLCSKAIWLEKGELVKLGSPADIVPQYQSFLDLLSSQPDATPLDVMTPPEKNSDAPKRPPKGEYARLVKVSASTDQEQGDRLNVISGVTDVRLDIEFVSTLTQETPQLAIAIHNSAGQLISSCASWIAGIQPTVNQKGQGNVTLTLPCLPLLKGSYYVGVLLFCQRGLFLHDEADPVVTLDVSQTTPERGLVQLPNHWQITTPQPKLSQAAKVTRRQPTDRWHGRPVRDSDLPAIKKLYQQAFGHELDEAVWRWKYQYAKSAGYVAVEGDDVVAFCGGAPREGLVQGQPTVFCQMGDTMVAPAKRGVLTKTGPFYHCVYPFMGQQIGQGRQQSFAFGFPNRRALRVGERQGVYASFDRILEHHWAPNKGTYLLTPWQGDRQGAEQIDCHWRAMQPYLAQRLVGLRNQAWLRFRYLEKPHGDYKVLFVQPQDQGVGAGVIVLKDRPQEDYVELLDFIGTPDQVHHLILAAQQYTYQCQRSHLMAWLTPAVAEWLQGTGGQSVATDVVIAGNGLDNPQHTAVAIDNWWLMGGDSDFR